MSNSKIHTIRLRFAVGTSVQDEKKITDLPKQVQTGITFQISYFVNDLESLAKCDDDKYILKNKSIGYDANGRIRLELIIASSIEYNDLLESIDIIKYWEYPGVISETSNKTYHLIDMEYV